MKHKLRVELQSDRVTFWIGETQFVLGPEQIEWLAEQKTGGMMHVSLNEKMERVELALEATLACVRDTDAMFQDAKARGGRCVELPSYTTMKAALRVAGVLS